MQISRLVNCNLEQQNGALADSITMITDVTHLHGPDEGPSWSVVDRLEDGTSKYLVGSGWNDVGGLKSTRLFSQREQDVLNLSARGFTIHETAKRMGIGYETIITHRKKILKKTRSRNMPEAVAFAINLGYL